MINISNYEVLGIEHAIRGMRNPMNSWNKSDSDWKVTGAIPRNRYIVGKADKDLMLRLAKSGTDHAKFRRMIAVYLDIEAPLYWWKEFDTYKVGTVANSCSTMHKIHAKEFEANDFSCEHLIDDEKAMVAFRDSLNRTIADLNTARELFLSTKDKVYWWQMIQLLPSSYNQRRTVMLNYEVLHNIYHARRNHKLDEWHTFCEWIETLPYRDVIIVSDKE